MQRSAEEHRQEFRELGYTVFKGVLTREEIAYGSRLFDEVITLDTSPPVVVHDSSSRRQLSVEYCEPRLAQFGGSPGVLKVVGMMMDRPFRLLSSPIPTITFPGKAGGLRGRDWQGHVDWWRVIPREFWESYFNCFLHFTTVEPGGGAFAAVPGSHHLVRKNLSDPDVSERMFRQEFQDFPGLGSETEVLVQAGGMIVWHPYLVHGPTDNQHLRARKVLAVYFMPILDGAAEQRAREGIPRDFHQGHLAAMDRDFKQLCGLA